MGLVFIHIYSRLDRSILGPSHRREKAILFSGSSISAYWSGLAASFHIQKSRHKILSVSPILCIETSGKHCSIAVFNGTDLLSYQACPGPNDHAKVIISSVVKALEIAHLGKKDLAAVALSAGPGSYTGLRIGAATAKGLCHGLGIPLIAISSLELMAEALSNSDEYEFLIPMIDARRNEVYSAVFRPDLSIEHIPGPLVLEVGSFEQYRNHRVAFLGDGALKWKEQAEFNRADYFPEIYADARFMGKRAHQKWQDHAFENIAYFEPEYLKPVFLNS